jgi:hypothetical protein
LPEIRAKGQKNNKKTLLKRPKSHQKRRKTTQTNKKDKNLKLHSKKTYLFGGYLSFMRFL